MEKEIIDLKKDVNGCEKLKNFKADIKIKRKNSIRLTSTMVYNFDKDLIEKQLNELKESRHKIIELIDSERPFDETQPYIQSILMCILGLDTFPMKQLETLKDRYKLETSNIKDIKDKFILVKDIENIDRKINLDLIRRLVGLNREIRMVEKIQINFSEKEAYKENTYLTMNTTYKKLDINYCDMDILIIDLYTNGYSGSNLVQHRLINYLNFLQYKYDFKIVDYRIDSHAVHQTVYLPKKFKNEILNYLDEQNSILDIIVNSVTNTIDSKNFIKCGLQVASRFVFLDKNLDVISEKAYFVKD